MKNDIIVFDVSNLFYISAYRLQKKNIKNNNYNINTIYSNTIQFMRKLYYFFKSKHIIFACDSTQYYWRSKYFSEYKKNRKMTTLRKNVRNSIKFFKEKNFKLCIEVPGCEADDIIYCLINYKIHNNIIIVSSDRDFIQLQSTRVRLFNPHTYKFRKIPEKLEYELFIKCIRGDVSDNIPSAYPYVRESLIKEAYYNPYKFFIFMKKKLSDNIAVYKKYQRNRLLIDMKFLPKKYISLIKILIDKLSLIEE